MFTEWENGLREESLAWKRELTRLENQPIDKNPIFEAARDRVMDLLRQAAKDVNLLPGIR